MSKIAQFAIEELIPSFTVSGGATAILHEERADWDPDYWGENLRICTQINTDQAFHFHVAWRQEGPLARHLDPDMKWKVEVLMEQVGRAEFELPANLRVEEINYRQGTPVNYRANFRIPKRTVRPGVYRIVVVLTLRDPGARGADQWMPIAGFADMGYVQFYED